MIVPFIVSVGREVLLSVPREQREAALALGATRWESTWKVVLPYARPGLYGAIFLALGRALGETMAVTMVIGNRPEIAASLFAPAYSMAAVIANEFSEATEELYLHALIEVGLVAVRADHGRQRRRARADRAPRETRERAMRWLPRNRRRRLVNVVMLGMTAVFTLLSISVLFFVLGYLVVKGGRSLNLAFFTDLPKPVGETGGGMANALVGSAKMLGIAAAHRAAGRPAGGSLPERVRRAGRWRTSCATRPTC